jgi:enoyl-CoA hydratase/carnithine racemase
MLDWIRPARGNEPIGDDDVTTSTPFPSGDVGVERDGHVVTVELRRPPHNFFDIGLVREIAGIYEQLDADPECRVILLAAQGSAFCAGADFSGRGPSVIPEGGRQSNPLYDEALRLFSCRKPVVAAVHGPAVGGGLGLALSADFRVTCPAARFAANFARLGIHCGFGISVTLPRLVGVQKASTLLYTGRRIGGEEAFAIGLADVLAADGEVRFEAMKLAREIAGSAPLAVASMRDTLRAGLVEQVRQAVAREGAEQVWQFATEDFKEGVAATAARRAPVFHGR